MKNLSHPRSKITHEESEAIVGFIRGNRHHFSNKTECFKAALGATGLTDKLKCGSTSVDRYFKKAKAAPKTNGKVHKTHNRRGRVLSDAEVTALVNFIRARHMDFPNKAACFTAAMEATGTTGKIANNSMAVQRYFKKAKAAEKAEKKTNAAADVLSAAVGGHNNGVKRKYNKRPKAERVEHQVSLDHCPKCGYDLHTHAVGTAIAEHVRELNLTPEEVHVALMKYASKR